MKHVFPERAPVWATSPSWIVFAVILILNLNHLYEGNFSLLRFLAVLAFMIAAFFIIDRMKTGVHFVELDEEELAVFRPSFIPSKRWRFPLDEVDRIEIHGPKGKRYWRVHLKDSSSVEIPPIYNVRLDNRMTQFMQEKVPAGIPVEVKPPSSMFAEIRGDFD